MRKAAIASCCPVQLRFSAKRIREFQSMLVAPWAGSLLAREQERAAFKTQLSAAFGRAELRRSASTFIDGLLSGVARKSGLDRSARRHVARVSCTTGLTARFAADGLNAAAPRGARTQWVETVGSRASPQ
jgi:hypothetical protein